MRATAGIASLFVVLAGFGVGTYCIGFRPAGVQPATASLELGILGGAVVLLGLVSYFAIVSGAKRAGGGVQRLLNRALEIDATDPDVIGEFAAVPALRDLVAGWIAERAQVRDLSDRVEVLRGEMDGIADGMRRSSQDLGRIRDQPSNPLGVQIVASWNTLVERLKQAEGNPTAAQPLGPSNEPIVRTLVARLDELESELDRLRGHAAEAPALEILGNDAGPSRDAAPAFTRADTLRPVPARDRAIDLDAADALDLGDALELDEALELGDPLELGEALELEGAVELGDALESGDALEILDASEDDSVDLPVAIDPQRVAAQPPAAGNETWGKVEVVAPLPRSRGWQVQSAPVAQPGDPTFEDLDFPHFVGKPVRPLEDRVAVTYEGQDAAAEAAELPANALIFDDDLLADEPPVFDLGRMQKPERNR